MLLGEDLGSLKETQREYLRMIYDANEEIISRIDELLTAVNIEEGTALVKKENISLDSIVLISMKELEKRSKLKKVAFTYVPPVKPLPSIYGDANKLRLVLHILSENAVDYTGEGGSISASLAEKGGKVRFEISDTGIGIPEVDQSKIFERFFRGSNAMLVETDAFGIGLTLAKYYAEKHSGSVGFQSKEGVGSTFWFEIPILSD